MSDATGENEVTVKGEVSEPEWLVGIAQFRLRHLFRVMNSMDVVDRNRRAFGRQAAGFSADGDTYGAQADIDWMLADLPLRPGFNVLDVASGTGEFARALAPHVASVTALEATDAMRKRGERLLREAGIDNVTFVPGIAERMPFENASFDIVASRYAMHHLGDPKPVIADMARVARSSAYLIIVDIVQPENAPSGRYDYYEWLRDDSHTRCLQIDELRTLCDLFDFEVLSARSRTTESSVTDWLDFAFTPGANRQSILEAIEAERGGGPETGLSPLWRDGALYFKQTDVSLVARKRDPAG